MLAGATMYAAAGAAAAATAEALQQRCCFQVLFIVFLASPVFVFLALFLDFHAFKFFSAFVSAF